MMSSTQRGSDYYSKSLSGQYLQRCYDIAPPRVQQYLNAEIDYTLVHLAIDATVLELGCGYGRVLRRIADQATQTVGIDTSRDSLHLARRYLTGVAGVYLMRGNAVQMSVRDESVDIVVCIQNGISAFGVDPMALVREGVRVTRPGGRLIVSTYSGRFWPHRLEWFKRQADAELIGAIDWEQTRDGVIICRDGFRATTFQPDQLRTIAETLSLTCQIEEVDESSVFCVMQRP